MQLKVCICRQTCKIAQKIILTEYLFKEVQVTFLNFICKQKERAMHTFDIHHCTVVATQPQL